MADVAGYPGLRWVGGAASKPAEQAVAPALLQRLSNVARQLGVTIDIFSGSGDPSVRGAGFAGDPHSRGVAVDASIRGVPLGSYPGAVAALHAQGVRSGATDFTYQGKPDPAHADLLSFGGGGVSQPQTQGFASVKDQADYIAAGALKRGLDPAAVLSIAQVEGLGKGIGDNGTSFGPFQLHKGGAYPSSAPQDPAKAQQWANSPAGIDYALNQIQKVAGGKQGLAAITAIASRFERPTNVAGEVSAANKNYKGFATYLKFGGANSAIFHDWNPGGPLPSGSLAGEAITKVEGVGGFLSKITDPSFILRGLQVVAGGALVLVGTVLLAKQVALAPDAPTPKVVAAPAAAVE